MPERAQITSSEALETFRSQLVVYLSKARPALEEVAADVVRMRMWLENDQRLFWEGQVRQRQKALEQAQQALFSARIASLREESAVEQMAFHRARRALDEAQDKLRVLKKWNREFESRVQPLVKQTEKLHTVLSSDVPQAVAYLNQVLNTLAAYAEAQLQGSPSPSAPPVPNEGEASQTSGAGARTPEDRNA
jgi:uncharacterized protein (UPF0305 family)